MPAYGRKLPLNGHFRLSKQVVQVVRTQFPLRVSNEWAVTYPINAGNHVATFGTKNTSASRIRLIATQGATAWNVAAASRLAGLDGREVCQ